MDFDPEQWKKQLEERLGEFARNPREELKRAGTETLFGFLVGMTIFPVAVVAAQHDGLSAGLALGGVAGGIGAKLIGNKLQRWHDEATAGKELEKELADSPQLRETLDDIVHKLDVIEEAQRGMNEDDRHWFTSQLGRELQPYQTDLPRVYAQLSRVSDSLVVISERDTYITYVTYIVNQLSSRELPEADLRQATERYLQYLVDRYQYLDFKGMGISERVPLRLPLLEMYIPVKARIEVPEADTWPEELRLAGRKLRVEEQEGLARRLGESQPVLDLLREQDGLVVLGDPGSGKTTFLKYLALKLAQGEGEELGLGKPLPVLVPLSAYANALAEAEVRLDEFIADYFCERVADLPTDQMLAAALEQGGALVLLDGLDEVRELSLRETVVERVVDFYAFHRRAGNKFALTSRIVGYREVRPTAQGLAECTLVDFGDEEIQAFVDRWTAAIERAAIGETDFAEEEAERERGELLDAIRANPGVRGLAANPLLLTILALMKRQGVRLPDRRVELYDKYVEVLLSSWNRARGLGRPPARDLDVVETLRILAPMALWMHQVSPGVGLVKQQDVSRKLAEIYGQRGEADPEQAVQQFLDDVHEYAGLLLERGAGQYGFIHLTFEEYLAAVGVARLGQRDIEPVVDLLAEHVGEPAWREVAQLTIGYLGIVQQWDEVASGVVGELIDRAPGENGQALALMGEAVADAAPGGVTPACIEKLVPALVEALGEPDIKAPLRAASGRALAKLGDPRPEVMTVQHMQFCYVPPGPFWMGSDRADTVAWDYERPVHEVDIPDGYWIGGYPVTNAQYRAFLEDADGYDSDQWWTATGLAWREEERRRHLPERCAADNHPAVSVTWYEGVAFARWLGNALRENEFLPGGWVARLPSEREWEKAARGGTQIPVVPVVLRPVDRLGTPDEGTLAENPLPRRLYPWGDEPDPEAANYSDTGILRASAVGCFPTGASAYGVEELSGSVWEWCATKWHEDYRDYREDNDPDGDAPRVLRGGSFPSDEGGVRCACRFWDYPGGRFSGVGFRVVVCPSSPD